MIFEPVCFTVSESFSLDEEFYSSIVNYLDATGQRNSCKRVYFSIIQT